MIQPHNRHSSMSLYLASIAVVDTIILSIGEYSHFVCFSDATLTSTKTKNEIPCYSSMFLIQ